MRRIPSGAAERRPWTADSTSMQSLAQFVERQTVATRQDAIRAGYAPRQLAAAVAQRELVRIRRGWYTVPTVPIEVHESIRAGGLLTCQHAAATYGLWQAPSAEVHVRLPRNAARLQNIPGVLTHWTNEPLGKQRGDRWRATAVQVCSDVFGCTSVADAHATLNDAIRLGLLDQAECERVLASVSTGLRIQVLAIGFGYDSGAEVLAAHRLARMRIPFEHHVRFAGVGTTDFVLNERIVLEIDGFAFHSTREQFENDRRRDHMLLALGLTVIRIPANWVINRPKLFDSTVRQALQTSGRR